MQIHAFTKMGSKESAQIKEVQRRKMTPKNKKSKKDCFCWDLNLSLGYFAPYYYTEKRYVYTEYGVYTAYIHCIIPINF